MNLHEPGPMAIFPGWRASKIIRPDALLSSYQAEIKPWKNMQAHAMHGLKRLRHVLSVTRSAVAANLQLHRNSSLRLAFQLLPTTISCSYNQLKDTYYGQWASWNHDADGLEWWSTRSSSYWRSWPFSRHTTETFIACTAASRLIGIG